MKGLILKDLYNIVHNMKSMVLMLLCFAVFYLPGKSADSFTYVCVILCAMMTLTTFSFDSHSGWTRYAMVMPISRDELVLSKFIVHVIFCAMGSIAALLFGLAGGLVFSRFAVEGWLSELFINTFVAFVLFLCFGSTAIPLVIKFGTEKARLFMLLSYLFPAALILGIYKLISFAGIELNPAKQTVLLCASALLILGWLFAAYKLSCKIFRKQEL